MEVAIIVSGCFVLICIGLLALANAVEIFRD